MFKAAAVSRQRKQSQLLSVKQACCKVWKSGGRVIRGGQKSGGKSSTGKKKIWGASSSESFVMKWGCRIIQATEVVEAVKVIEVRDITHSVKRKQFLISFLLPKRLLRSLRPVCLAALVLPESLIWGWGSPHIFLDQLTLFQLVGTDYYTHHITTAPPPPPTWIFRPSYYPASCWFVTPPLPRAPCCRRLLWEGHEGHCATAGTLNTTTQ